MAPKQIIDMYTVFDFGISILPVKQMLIDLHCILAAKHVSIKYTCSGLIVTGISAYFVNLYCAIFQVYYISFTHCIHSVNYLIHSKFMERTNF